MFRVAATETIRVPANRAKILQADITKWKGLPLYLNAVSEPLKIFQANQDVSIPNTGFDVSEEVIPVVFNNMTGYDVTVDKNTLRSSEVVKDHFLSIITQARDNGNGTS